MIARACHEVLSDPVTERFAFGPPGWADPAPGHSIEVTSLPGVTDTAAEHLLEAMRTLGLPVTRAATGMRFVPTGAYNAAQLRALARDQYCNEVVQRFTVDTPIVPVFVDDAVAANGGAPGAYTGDIIETLGLRDIDDAALLALSAARRLALDLAEMRAIQAHYRGEQRDPTDLELEMLAQTWSEHCVHKTFKALID